MTARLLVVCLATLTCAGPLGCGGNGSSIRTTNVAQPVRPGLDRATQRALSVKAKPVDPRLRPELGGPHTAFVVAFTARQRTGVIGQARRAYEAYVRGPGHIGCQFDTASGGRSTKAGQPVRIVLDPHEMEGPKRWCSGHFEGTVKFQRGYACPPHANCHIPPAFPRPGPQTVGHFDYTVR